MSKKSKRRQRQVLAAPSVQSSAPSTSVEPPIIDKWLEYVTKGVLLATFIIPPFIVINSLFFPFVSGRVYAFRLLVEISLFFWLLLIARRPEFRPRIKNPLVLSVLLFLLGLTVTAFLGVDVTHSFFSNIERSDGIVQFAHWAAYFLMLASTFRTSRDWKIFLWVFVAVAFGVAAYAWMLQEPRLAGFFNNPSYLAAFMLFAIGVSGVLWAIYGNQKRQGWLGLAFGILALFFVATLIFTQTRGSYLGLIAGFLFFTLLLLLSLRKEKRKLTFASLAISLITFAAIGSIFLFKDSDFVTRNQILNRIADAADLTNVAAVRERFLGWEIAGESFRDKPMLGWGPENFDIAFNSHYKFLAAKDEAWFDSSHNQLFDILAEGGIVGFASYLFWIGSIFFVTTSLLKRKEVKNKIIGAILSSTYLAFLVQGWFLFDTFPFYLGLFPMLSFAYFKYEQGRAAASEADNAKRNKFKLKGVQFYVLVVALLLVAPYLIFKNVWQPYQANSLIYKYHSYLNISRYKEAGLLLEQASQINSPFTNFDVGNQSSWSMLYVLDAPLPETSREDAHHLFKLVAAREENSLTYRPLEPQVYYVLGRLYRLGFLHFGDPNYLAKAEEILRQGRTVSPDRAEYVNELGEVLLLQGRNEEVETMVKEHASKIGPPYSYMFIGHLYFLEQKYDLALEEYLKAEAIDFPLWANDINYNRYVLASQEAKNYEGILKLSEGYIAHRKPRADVYFNEAVAHYYLGHQKEARDSFFKAIALDRSYEQFSQFFVGQ